MTYLEAIREELQPYPVRNSLIARKCEKFGVWENNDETDEKVIAQCVIDILYQMKTTNAVGEGGVNISFDTDKVDEQIKKLCNENGLDSSMYVNEPTVRYLGDL